MFVFGIRQEIAGPKYEIIYKKSSMDFFRALLLSSENNNAI